MTTSIKRSVEATRVTLVGLICNVLLVAAKLAAGVFGRSSALIADAVHSLSDIGTDLVAIAGVRLSRKPADAGHPYGHGKIETLAAAVIGTTLIVVGLGMLIEGGRSLLSFIDGRLPPRPSVVAAGVAAVSLIGKEALFRYTRAAARRLDSQTLEANAWHQRSDALSSAGTTSGVLAASLLGGWWRILDPVAALIVSVIIAKVGGNILRKSVHELLDGAAGHSFVEQVTRSIHSVPGATNPHDVRVRRLGCTMAVDAHLEVDAGMPIEAACDVTDEADRAIRRSLGPDTMVTLRLDVRAIEFYTFREN